MNEIDLSKLSIKETPTKTIKANFDGTEKDFTISALTDVEQNDFQVIANNSSDVFRNRNMHVLLLSCGLGIAQEVAGLIYEHAHKEAVRVANIVFEFTKEFAAAKAEEAGKAEKNLPPTAETPSAE